MAAVAAGSGGVSGGKPLAMATATTPGMPDPAATAAAGCCLKPAGAAPLVVQRGVGSLSPGEGEGEQSKISFEAALAHHTHVVLPTSASEQSIGLLHSLAAQTVLLRRWWQRTRARSPSSLSPTQCGAATSEDDSGGGGRSGEPPRTRDGRSPHM